MKQKSERFLRADYSSGLRNGCVGYGRWLHFRSRRPLAGRFLFGIEPSTESVRHAPFSDIKGSLA